MTLAEFLALFDLTPAGQDRFIGHSPDNGWRRVFGGQVLAQSLVAAERTVDGVPPHSLHGYFLLGGDPKEPIAFEVERLRNGRSFTTRRIVARQRGEAIFTMVASFHAPEAGLDHAVAPSRRAAPARLRGLAHRGRQTRGAGAASGQDDASKHLAARPSARRSATLHSRSEAGSHSDAMDPDRREAA